MTNYLKIIISCSPDLHELLIAELSASGYDSFQEIENELEAFIDAERFDENEVVSILKKYGISPSVKVEKLKNVNWNEEWEKNFEPVYVGDQVQIRAAFHAQLPNYDFDIVINPKMSFGTGHHESTYLMVSEQLKIDHQNKHFLDVGTGTGILAIMAQKKGSKSITATDIDDWCISNSKENFALNAMENYSLLQGTIDKLTFPEPFDIIFANINKNVLLAELAIYANLLTKDGLLVLSGFYQEDIDDLTQRAAQSNLKLLRTNNKNNWAMMVLNRS